jgi:hypothetical protein
MLFANVIVLLTEASIEAVPDIKRDGSFSLHQLTVTAR